ncbi:hypothetical protein HGRIS_003833 [Hohenbuehelia grisea]|uniref:Protein-S-isoprenylcysteine O-methyltransferase n=1 Tax=Hohenbuehelia grisea TaxID=104357 RepID=A0ABR3JHF8_9AGAR
MCALFKPLALAIGAVCFRICFKPPAPPLNPENAYTGNLFERLMHPVVFFLRKSAFTLFMTDISFHIASALPQTSQIKQLIDIGPYFQPATSHPHVVTPVFVLGFTISLLSTALRVWSYKTLGNLFTFEVTLKPSSSHTLVTSGPYAYTRHPGYLGVLAVEIGVAMMLLADHGWIRECKIMATPLGVFIVTWLGTLSWVSYSLWRRIEVEDRTLKATFGSAWETYAQAVPYKLIPGVY